MSNVWIVLKREFMERVKTKSFLLATFLFPIFIIGLNVLPHLMGGEESVRHLVVVDEAPEGVARMVVASLSTPAAEREGRGYRLDVVRQPLAQVQAGLRERITRKEIDGYIHLPADVVASSQVAYRARNVSNLDVMSDIRRAASQAVQETRLRTAGLRANDVRALLRPVDVSTARVTATGEEGGSAIVTFIAAYAMAMLMWLMVFLYGVNVMRSVLEEKTNRIVEVLVSSMKASDLMMGKILGVGLVALLQVAIWVVLIATGLTIAGQRLKSGGAASIMAGLKLTPQAGITLFSFFVLGFFLYAAVFAAIGAAVTTDQEGQQFQTFAMVPLMLPVLFFPKVIGDPLGTTATVLGLVPFTAPVANAMRLGSTEIPVTQVIASLVMLALTTVLVVWIAGKIYRFGILSTGKKASLADIGRWMRAA
ncbi:MAG TPA: ABC transporter permease [Longimicrobium sp.]|jgi:ABC-2 type transport system permease protein